MSRQTRSSIFSVLLIVIVLISSIGNGMAFAAPSDPETPSRELKATPTLSPPTVTPTPVVQVGAKPQAWIDASIDLDQFPPNGILIVHFNTPMSANSSPNPILSWPAVEGVSSWDSTGTVLNFRPASHLDSKKIYTFFLDPSLRSTAGDMLENAHEWIVHVQSGPKIVSVSPEPGSLEQHYRTIEVQFDRDMKKDVSNEKLSIEPPVPFELKWKGTRILHIILGQPLEPDQRYDLTLHGGNDEQAVFATDGTYLAEEYRWFYWQKPFEIQVDVLGKKSVGVKFNYLLDREKSGIPFSISPALEGEWKWSSAQQINFIAKEDISSSQEYTLNLAHALVDSQGFEISEIPVLSFSGLPPIHVISPDIVESEYSDTPMVDPDVESIRINFDVPVDHASAEKAFMLDPELPGKFQWEKGSSGSKEVLVYALKELLKPSTKYTLTIGPSVLDKQGKKMIVQPYEQSFETNYWAYLFPSFGEMGDNIQVVDANGSRRIQFGGGDEQTSFAAYPFDLIDFAKLYADYYDYRRGGNNVRDIPIPADLKPAAVWKNISTRKVDGGAIEETTLPLGLAPGLYVLNMRHGSVLYDQLFLVVTRNTLVVKNDGEDLFVWLTNINGENVPDAEIRLYSTTGEKVREGQTDENGQYRVSIPMGSEPMLVSARVEEHGLSGDVTLAGFYGWYSDFPYNYDDPSDYLPDGQPYLAYLYTERPIYRPGQVVNFKAIIRKDNDVRYEVPGEGTPVKTRVLDARGNAIENMELLTNRFGSVHGTIHISEGAMLGHYQIETDVNGVITTQTFQVEDYRKPDYQVKITSLQPEKENRFVQGEEMKVRINAEYYFGEPLTNAKLDVKFYYSWEVDTRITGSLVTDEKGETTISFPAPYNPDYDNYYYGYRVVRHQTMRMDVTVNDGSNQTVTSSYQFSVYPASEQLKLETSGYYAQPGKSFSVTAKALDLFDQPVAGRKLSLAVSSWNRKTFEFDHPEQTIAFQTDANGVARQEIQLSAGYHRLTLSGVDSQGHKMEVSRGVYVFGTKQDWFERSREQFLMISAEKDSYKPYDTARFAIESTFSGPALLTFERGSVINTKIVELMAPLTIVETEIIPEHAPNVYVTVNAWQAGSQDVGRNKYWYSEMTYADSYLRLAKTQIQVDSTAKALDISITPDKQTYLPGEKLNAVIQVKDSAGKPVVAELSLAVVDEAIYGLASDFADDIFDAFYGPRAHTVDTFDSMSPYRIIMEGGRGGGGGGYEAPPATRSEFLDTSAWLPVIETDANGQATVTIELPDNTTSWRLSVKAITLDHQVGQTETNIETRKDVFVRPVLPRVLTSGDQATLTVFIHNYSTEAQTVTVNLSAPGLEIRSQNDEQITVEPGKVRPVGWRVLVQSAKPTQVTMTVRSAAGVLDKVILPLSLQPAAIKDVQNQSGQFSGTLTLALALPEVERETSEVRLTLNRSMSGTLLNGLEYLTGYPYGCVEQTMSRALPNAVVGRAANQLGVGGPEMQARLDPLIKASIQRLYGLQHSDGGWGWWTDDVSDPYQTAWVLFGLGVMDSSGYSIEPKVMDNAVEWLQHDVLDNPELDIRTRAYVLYSMAQARRGDLEKTKELVSTSIYELDPFSQAALAIAMNRLGEKEKAQAILDLLSESALEEGEYVYWPQPSYDGEYHSKTMASSVRTTALVLLAYTEIEPENEIVPGIVNYLADQRQGIYGWGTTNETSFTILGLTEYLVREQNKVGNTPYEILVNGRSLVSGILEVGHSSVGIDIPLTELKDGLNALVVTTQGGSPVYFDLSTRYDLLQRNVQAAGNIQVTRRYLDPKTKAPIGQFQAGQLVKVELHVNAPQDVFFLAVEDYLPGGFEALNEGLNASNQVNVDEWEYEEYQPFFWQEYGYNYKEVRGDRVVFFITSFEKGSDTFTYYARATTSGQFVALPAQVYAMYDLSLWGRSESSNIQINK